MSHPDTVSRGRRARRALFAALVAVLPVLQTSGASSQPTPTTTSTTIASTSAAGPHIDLLHQTPTVPAGGVFAAVVHLEGIPDDGSLELAVFGRVRSRSELAASMEGEQLRGQVYRISLPIASLPAGADGSRQITLSLDPSVAGGLSLTAAGVYPVEIHALDADGTSLSSLITHLILRPDPADPSPPLAVAVVAQIDSTPSLQPDGSIDLPPDVIAEASALAAALAATPDTPATLAVRPELLDALGASADPAAAALLDQLKAAAVDRTVMALPYVDVSPDALVDADLDGELGRQLEQGRLVLANALGRTATVSTWMAGPDLDLAGLRLLERSGVRHLVVAPAQVQPLRSGLLTLSLAQPFVIRSSEKPAIDAMALDPRATALLGTDVAPGLEVSRVLAEIALLWFEQPAIARGVVLPVGLDTRGEVLSGLLEGIDDGHLFESVALDRIFTKATALRQPGGSRVDRALRPADLEPISGALARDIVSTRARLRSFATLVGPDSPTASLVTSHLFLATSTELTRTERQAHLNAASASMKAVTSAIDAPPHETVTLTARDGNVPLTLRNDSGLPVNVVVHLKSPKLEFPGGTDIPLTLAASTTRIDISVRARASGRFPLDVTVTSPDGALMLAAVDYRVQSTAVSGVGLVLSIGAAIFLLVWWARHWRRTRRSGKLIAAEQLATERAQAAALAAEPSDPPSR